MKFRSVGDAGDAAQRLRSGGFGPLPAGAAIAYAGPFETAFRKPVHEIVTEIDIHASAPQVWAALTDFSAYRKWNPVIVSVDGSLAEGARLEPKLRPEALRHSSCGSVSALKAIVFRSWCALNAMRIRVRVTKLLPERELRWVGSLPVPGMFEGEHYFLIADTGNGSVHFTQGERYAGLLEPVFREVIEAINRGGYDAMNLALKHHVEAHCQ